MYDFGMPVTVMIEWISCGAGKGYTTWKYEDGFQSEQVLQVKPHFQGNVDDCSQYHQFEVYIRVSKNMTFLAQ